MNFYKHHIGDYAQATAHLSFIEDAAYCRLIRKYYAEEKPLPADLKAAQRLVGARTREEKNAVETVLEEFFSLEADGWHNKRCDEELLQWKAQAETNRRIAIEREAKKGKKSSNETTTKRARENHDSSYAFQNDSLNDSSASREPNQNPESRIQNPESRKLQTLPPPAAIARTWWPSLATVDDLHGVHGFTALWIDDQVASFVAYWHDRGEARTSWDALFVDHCMKRAKFQGVS